MVSLRSGWAVFLGAVVLSALLVGCASGPREAVPAAAAASEAAAQPQEAGQAPAVAAATATAEEPATAEPTAVEVAPVRQPEKVGILTKRVRLLSDGSVERTTLYRLDSGGLVEREESRDSGGELVENVTYTYAGGLLVEKASLDAAGERTSTRRYTYGASGLETETLLNGRGVQQSRSSYSYDADSMLASWTIYDGAGTLLGTVVYRYAAGRLAEAESRGPGGNAEGYTVYEYDAEGRNASERTLSADRRLERSVARSYTGKALTEERYLSAGGSVERTISYEVDTLGNPVIITTRDSKGRVISTQTLEYRYVER